MASALDVAVVVAAVGCGIMAGLFFSFSVFLMAAFDRLPAAHAIAAMQAINRTIITPLFLVAFLGSAVACVTALVLAVLEPEVASPVAIATATASYVVGVLVVTGVANVPRNNHLDSIDPAATDAEAAWADYRGPWTAWNHVRTVASLAATAMLVTAAS